ncbi:hypothetical protein ACHAXN_010028 [Cyclotella atomus]
MSSEEDRPQNQDPADPETLAKQRRDRLEQNRISARESRKRKKTMIEELQRTVITLSKENKELNERNEFLRRELVEIGTKHPGLVPIQALMRGGALAAALAGMNQMMNPALMGMMAGMGGYVQNGAGGGQQQQQSQQQQNQPQKQQQQPQQQQQSAGVVQVGQSQAQAQGEAKSE